MLAAWNPPLGVEEVALVEAEREVLPVEDAREVVPEATLRVVEAPVAGVEAGTGEGRSSGMFCIFMKNTYQRRSQSHSRFHCPKQRTAQSGG